MISYNREKQVRELLACEEKPAAITRNTGISFGVIAGISSMMAEVERMGPHKVDEVHAMLKAGFPIGRIELETKTARVSIVAVRRYFYLHKRSFDPCSGRHGDSVCPTCKQSVLAAYGDAEEPTVFRPPSDRPVGTDDYVRLCEIAYDVVELVKLRLIPSLLLLNLADKAASTLKKIYTTPGEIRNEEETEDAQ